MPRDAAELARRLAREAEAVCRHYLSNGKREGRYWLVGDVHNTPGRSMFVRLQDSPKGPAGKWTDAATGEHGDLLDIIRESLGLRDFREVAEEARRFLNLPRTNRNSPQNPFVRAAPAGSQEAARRLFAISQPIEGTVVETYLQRRGIAHVHHGGSLRFHPRCYYRPDEHLPTETWPAMIACVTDLDGRITGVHRTWLDPDGFDRFRLGKAPIDTPRRAMGDLLGNAVRFGAATTMCSSPAKASRPCCRYAACFRPCPWPRHFRPITSRPCCYRRVCVASISLATPTPPETRCSDSDAARRSRRHRGDRVVAPARRLQRRSARLRSRRPPSSVRIQLVPEDIVRFLLSSTAVGMTAPASSMSTISRGEAQCRPRPRPRPSRGRSDGKRPGPAMAAARLFSAAPCGPLHREAK